MITFEIDVSVERRNHQPKFYGFIPDDHGLRGRCFVLMTLMSALHNFSRSVGYALLAASGGSKKMWLFVCGEMLLYLTWKVARRDFMYWVRVEGALGFLFSFFERVLGKVVADFSGCLHYRHPFEIGGFAFTLSMLWAQAMPFVALWVFTKRGDDDGEAANRMNGSFNISNSTSQLTDENANDEAGIGGELEKSTIAIVLTCIFGLWLLTSVAFFSTIDLSYFHTFFGMTTASQCCITSFQESTTDSQKFWWVFGSRMSYTEPIHGEIKVWVSANVDRWREENPEWFDIELIPDEFLPPRVVIAEGGAGRRRSFSVSLSNSLRELAAESES